METTLVEKGNRELFCELIEQHRGIVLKVANTYCREHHDRDDLAQEIISQLWRAYPSYNQARKFSTWMYRIALNVAITNVRYHSRRPTEPLSEAHHSLTDDLSTAAETNHQVEKLYLFMDSLDSMNRALLLLYLQEHSHNEIAEILGISETNVSTKINRLKKRIKTEFTENHDGH